ncbi:MAG: pyridoxamine 5'-phosphate oxidase family protein [Acidimicrobiales bacterium]
MAATHAHDRTIALEAPSNAHPTLALVERAIGRRSFCVLGTVSPAGRPHAAGVIYTSVDDDLWVSMDRSSRKARNIAANRHVHVQIPVRRGPVGPPSSIQFAATAELFGPDDPEVRRLMAQHRLKKVTGHGELERPDAALVRIRPDRVLHTYGLGLSLLKLIRDPLRAGGRVERRAGA